MTERLRVLFAILSLSGREFTVFDVAEKTGVNVATVRTVLGRERRFVRDVGRSDGASRGGRAIKYALVESCVAELKAELSAFQAESQGWDGENGHQLKVIDPPVTLVAAEDVLLRQLDHAENPQEKIDLLASARRHLQATRATLQQMDDGSVDLRALTILTDGLEQHAKKVASSLGFADLKLSAPMDGLELHPNEVGPSPRLDSALYGRGYAVPCAGPAPSAGIDVLDLFRKSLSFACAKCEAPGVAISMYSPRTLMEAAKYFGKLAGATQGSPLSVDEVANKICRSWNPKFPIDVLVLLGREPASYQVGVVSLSDRSAGACVGISSHKFNMTCESLASITDFPTSPIQTRLADIHDFHMAWQCVTPILGSQRFPVSTRLADIRV